MIISDSLSYGDVFGALERVTRSNVLGRKLRTRRSSTASFVRVWLG
jgi:hypothetical protein